MPPRLPPPPPSGPPPQNARRLNQSSILTNSKTRPVDNTSRAASDPNAEGVQSKAAASLSSAEMFTAEIAAGDGAGKENYSRNLVEHRAQAVSSQVAARTAQQIQTFKAMIPIFSKHKDALLEMFLSYASKDRKHLTSHNLPYLLTEQSFLTFCSEKKLVPDLLSRVEAVESFRCSRSSGPSPSDGNIASQSSSFNSFLLALSIIAKRVFSGSKWDVRFPEDDAKLRLLLFWMDNRSELFIGNGAGLNDRVAENKAAVSAANAEIVFSLPLLSSLFVSFPQLAGIEPCMRRLFFHYCQVADRLNVGPNAGLYRGQFAKIAEDAGLIRIPDDYKPKDEGFLPVHVCLVFQAKLVGKEKCLRYDHFYDALAELSRARFKNGRELRGRGDKFLEKAVALHYLLLEYMLPLAEKVVAVTLAQKQRKANERRATDVRSSEWMSEWRNIEILRDHLRSDNEIREYFGVLPAESAEDDDDSSSSSRNSSSDGEGDNSKESVRGPPTPGNENSDESSCEGDPDRLQHPFAYSHDEAVYGDEDGNNAPDASAAQAPEPWQSQSLSPPRTVSKAPRSQTEAAAIFSGQPELSLFQAGGEQDVEDLEQHVLIKTVAELAERAKALHTQLLTKGQSSGGELQSSSVNRSKALLLLSPPRNHFLTRSPQKHHPHPLVGSPYLDKLVLASKTVSELQASHEHDLQLEHIDDHQRLHSPPLHTPAPLPLSENFPHLTDEVRTERKESFWIAKSPFVEKDLNQILKDMTTHVKEFCERRMSRDPLEDVAYDDASHAEVDCLPARQGSVHFEIKPIDGLDVASSMPFLSESLSKADTELPNSVPSVVDSVPRLYEDLRRGGKVQELRSPAVNSDKSGFAISPFPQDGLREKLAKMEFAVGAVQEKQQRNGSLLPPASETKKAAETEGDEADFGFIDKIVERSRAYEDEVLGDLLQELTVLQDDSGTLDDLPTLPPRSEILSSDREQSREEKSGALVEEKREQRSSHARGEVKSASTPPPVLDYRMALESAMSLFSDRFAALESKMSTIATNMTIQQLQTGKTVSQEQATSFASVAGGASAAVQESRQTDSTSSLRNPLSPRRSITLAKGEPIFSSPMRADILTSLAKVHSPPMSSPYTSIQTTQRGAARVGGTLGNVASTPDAVFSTPRASLSVLGSGGGPSSDRSSLNNRAITPVLRLTPRYSTHSSGDSFGNLSAISSSGGSETGSTRSRATSETSKPKSPFRTRDRMDDYYRSLPNESARRMSFAPEVNEARRNPNPIKLDVRESSSLTNAAIELSSPDEPLYRLDPVLKGKAFAEKALREGRRASTASATTSATPPKTYEKLHSRRHSVEAGMTISKQGGSSK